QDKAGKRLEGARKTDGRGIRRGSWQSRGRAAAAPHILAVGAAQAKGVPEVGQGLMPRRLRRAPRALVETTEQRKRYRSRQTCQGRARRLSKAPAVERVLHAPGARRPDLLIDLQSLPQMRSSFNRILVKQAAAHSFQRPRLFARCAKLAGDGERLSVMASGLQGRRG